MAHPDPPSSLLSADRPIEGAAQDRLGRRDFAEALARRIREWRGKDSLVVSLHGAWGSGKTSIKNMALEALGADSLVIEFNPWQFANRDQLPEAFFREVGTILGREAGQGQETQRRAAARWRAYAAYFGVGTSVIEQLRGPVVGALSGLGVLLLGSALLPAIPPGLKTFLGILGLVSGGIAAIFGLSKTVSEAVANAITARAESQRRPLHEVKRDLADSLRVLARPLVVVMDDVDRLTPAELQQLFQLIKANADFPNVVYLLLFQRDTVEKAINGLFQGSGRDFLEKIVQVGFDVPNIDPSRIDRVLFDGLDRVLASIEARGFDQQRWGNLYHGGLRPYFGSLRSVYRFLATLDFQVGLFNRDGVFEVNAIDLIGLEVLRIAEPEVYRAVSSNKQALTGRHEREDSLTRQRRTAIDAIIAQAPEQRRSTVSEIISVLFP